MLSIFFYLSSLSTRALVPTWHSRQHQSSHGRSPAGHRRSCPGPPAQRARPRRGPWGSPAGARRASWRPPPSRLPAPPPLPGCCGATQRALRGASSQVATTPWHFVYRISTVWKSSRINIKMFKRIQIVHSFQKVWRQPNLKTSWHLITTGTVYIIRVPVQILILISL